MKTLTVILPLLIVLHLEQNNAKLEKVSQIALQYQNFRQNQQLQILNQYEQAHFKQEQEKVVRQSTISFNSQDFGNMIYSYISQLLNEVILYNLNDCLYYGYEAADNYAAFALQIENPDFDVTTWQSLFLGIHQTPVVIRQCLKVKESVMDILNAYYWITVKSRADSIVSYATNLWFNGADLLEESTQLYQHSKNSDWENVGIYLAKITSDLLIKSPIRMSWSFRNSEIIPYKFIEDTTTPTDPGTDPALVTSKQKLQQSIFDDSLQKQHKQRTESIQRLIECISTYKFKSVIEKEETLYEIEDLISDYEKSEINSQEFDLKIAFLVDKYCQK